MKSFILALLPGLEEETGEFFEKVSPCPRTSSLLVIDCGPGPWSSGSSVRDRVPFFLPAKHMVNHAHDTLRSRDLPQLSVAAATTAQRGRRYATSFALRRSEVSLT